MATVIDVRNTGVTGKFLSDRSFRGPLTNRSAKILQVTSPPWPIASRCRCLMPISAGASLVSFYRIVLSRTSPLTNRSAKILQVTSPSWLIASRCRCLTPIGAGASLVNFSDRSFRGPVRLVRYESFRENASGDIAVLANCKSLSVFNAYWCRGITGKFLSDRSFRGPVCSRIVPRKFFR